MDLRHLQTFQAVLREGSFLKAARSLGLAQPTVSLHIQELEKELGLELFDRTGRERVKTPAGELLAGRALPILDAVEVLSRSMAELKDGKTGLLRLGAIEPAASRRLVPLLGRLRAQRPGLRIRLESEDGGGQPGRRGCRDRLGICWRRPPSWVSVSTSLSGRDGPPRAALTGSPVCAPSRPLTSRAKRFS
jgi:DNA-binding transcriptional LysR family regulator